MTETEVVVKETEQAVAFLRHQLINTCSLSEVGASSNVGELEEYSWYVTFAVLAYTYTCSSEQPQMALDNPLT